MAKPDAKDKHDLDPQMQKLAAMVYGESSAKDNLDEMYALASVLERQRIARGFPDISTFAAKDKNFSFVVSDGNPRYQKFTRASELEITHNTGMQFAIEAAQNAMSGGSDFSNRAFFWDGADIKEKYKTHAKVRVGIRFSKPEHNIYKIAESTLLVIKHKNIVRVDSSTGKRVLSREEIGRFDHVYESTAAWGGTIFWKLSSEYLQVMKAKEYR
ncbi:hypothetical protein GM655_10100 [Pseudoduganella danionis]|uniref:Uncharacterized protein n=2 Tax=Pseudoduganella danionis TaxID=1890295 RepID=A0ABW9SR60_9BURK|nr:hypothetical protein [Pseudoduganella danionis]MTW33177.1 hypothetical protein [Pseudoduganella danionis]